MWVAGMMMGNGIVVAKPDGGIIKYGEEHHGSLKKPIIIIWETGPQREMIYFAYKTI